MGKNSKNRRVEKTGQRHPGYVSLSTFRAGRALDALAPAFVQWFDDGSPGAAPAALAYLKLAEPVMGRYLDSTAAADVTRLEPVALAAAIAEEITAAADAGLADGESAAFTVDAVHTFVGFLSETGRWTGTAEQLEGVLDFIDTLAAGDGGPHRISIPEIPQDQALAVFSGLPLIQRATALLRWIGEGKPVTGTGALRLRDIEAAAACVGVTVRGATKRPAAGDDVPVVRSMYEVPLLAQMWAALEAAELIRVRSTRVVPFEVTNHFLADGSADQLEEFHMFTSCFLEQAVLRHDPEQPWERISAGLQASVLLAAATPDPPLVRRVLAAPAHAPEAERTMATLLTNMAVDRLEALAELGLLTIDTHFRVPPALIGCVADTFDNDRELAELGLGEASEDVEPQPAEPVAGGTRVKTPVPAAGEIVQLKIMLKGSKPPIWRRVLVPAGMPLSRLHVVIQGAFDWLDSHLHQFQTGGFRGPTYAPVEPFGEDDFYGERPLDESKVTVGELLPSVGSTMTYTYDFGDNWEHGITVEKILKSDDGGGQLPRCTAGRGSAPAEDSGSQSRPGRFDVEQVNGDLADLF